MNKISIVAICAALAVAPVLAQSPNDKANVNSAMEAPLSTAEFVRQVATSTMMQIRLSQIASDKATDASTQAYTKQMVADQTRTLDELKGLTQNGAVKQSLPLTLSDAQRKMLEKLKDLSNAEFAKQYRHDQLATHRHTVALFERYAQAGDNAALRDWAAKILPALRQRVQMAEGLEQSS